MTDSAAVRRGRAAFESGAWRTAFDAFSEADAAGQLSAGDLEALARSTYMLGDDETYVAVLERAHHAYLDNADPGAAVRAAFWIWNSLAFRGKGALARGWLATGQRILDEQGLDGPESGWLLIPAWLRQMGKGDFTAGYATTLKAADIARQFDDHELLWLARMDQARALMNLGRAAESLALVEELLVAVRQAHLSPMVTGNVYCSTLSLCFDAYAYSHAQEWTDALSEWCAKYPEMEAHLGFCLVHRADLLQLHGAWQTALDEIDRAESRHTAGELNQLVRGRAAYVQGEIHRLRGDWTAAGHCYREANERGFDPQPGFALLRLAQGNASAATAAIHRALAEATQPLDRARLLPTYIEIMLASGELETAREASGELQEIAANAGEALRAMASFGRGLVLVTAGEASMALRPLREALEFWQRLDVPYEAARTRAQIGLACRSMGDHDTGDLELAAARETFERLGATPELRRLVTVAGGGPPGPGLTPRELQVLRLVAAGHSNVHIAEGLFLSEHTVARHLQNIYAKLGVTSRTAAAAYAYTHELT